jgi:hypothetical protein
VTPLIRRYIKTSFVFLLAGLLLGAYIVVAEFAFDSYPPRLLVTPTPISSSSGSS